MTIPFWCLAIVTVLPIVWSFYGSFLKGKELGALDNRHPRHQTSLLNGEGPAARAYGAQANAWEALAMFTVAVVVSHLAGVPASEAAPWTIAFVVARVLHGIVYVMDADKLRSLSFLVGLVCIIALFVKAA